MRGRILLGGVGFALACVLACSVRRLSAQTTATRRSEVASGRADLDPAWSVGGIFVDAEGKPIPGAKITPYIPYVHHTGESPPSWDYFDSPVATDAEGKWHFDGVPARLDEVQIAVDHPDFIPSRRTFARTEAGLDGGRVPSCRIALRRGLTLTGKVTDEAGKPIGGALVRISSDRASPERGIHRAVTGPDGSYVLRGCEPRTTKMVASAPGHAINVIEFHLKPDMQPVDFQMRPAGTVRIRVIDQRGNPVPNARIWLREWGRSRDCFGMDVAPHVTDRQGRWECREASLDEIQAEIYVPGRAEIPRQSLVARKEEYVIRLPAVAPVASVAGTVVDKATHEPIKHFRVTEGALFPPSSPMWSWHFGSLASEGTYRIEPRHGNLVRIDADGYQPAVSRVLGDNQRNATRDFELTMGQDFEATVVTPDGHPAARAQVALCIPVTSIDLENGAISSRSTVAGLQETDDAGYFRLWPQEPGFGIVITHSSGYVYFQPSTHPSNRRIITLDPWTRVEGTYCLGGRPRGHIPLSIELTSRRRPGLVEDPLSNIVATAHATTGPNGHFVFERVEPGSGSVGRVLRNEEGSASSKSPSSSVAATFPLGKTVPVDISEVGHAVVGKLRRPAEFTQPVRWNFARVRAEPDDNEGYPLEAQLTAAVGPDGSFRIDNVPAGAYLLDVHFTQFPAGHLWEHHFVVPTTELNSPSKRIDLGDLQLQKD